MSSRKKAQLTVGKRKTSKARVVFTEGKGRIRINNTPIHLYQPLIAREKIIESVMVAGETADNVDIKVKVHGGGYMSQAEAARIGIATGFVKWTRGKRLRTAYIAYDRTMLAGDGRRRSLKSSAAPAPGEGNRRATGDPVW